MGIFQDNCIMINRTSKKLNVRFDGQDMTLLPNYDDKGKLIPEVVNAVPRVAIFYAKSQNVLMGSEDAIDPSDFITLVGVKAGPKEKQKDEISYLEQSKNPSRVNLADYLEDPNAKIQVVGSEIPRRSDASVKVGPGGLLGQ